LEAFIAEAGVTVYAQIPVDAPKAKVLKAFELWISPRAGGIISPCLVKTQWDAYAIDYANMYDQSLHYRTILSQAGISREIFEGI